MLTPSRRIVFRETPLRLLPPPGRTGVEPVRIGEGRTEKRRVLLVDDSQSHIDTLEMYFDPNRNEVLKATSGEEALEIFRRGGIPAVITDLQMPGMNGDRLATHIKQIDRTVKIILITGDANAIDRSLRGNLDGIVIRPYNGRHLISVLELALRS